MERPVSPLAGGNTSGTPLNSPGPALVRGIGLAGAGLLVLNSMIGAGIFVLPGVVAAQAGAAAPWLFLLVGLLFLSVVFCFAELSAYFSATGGPVLYAGEAFGAPAAFAAGWLLYVSRMTAFAANATAMAIYLGALWSPVAEAPGRQLFIAIVCIGFTAVNYRGVKDGLRTVAMFTLFKLAPLLLLVLMGLGELGVYELWPQALPQVDEPGQLVLLLIYAYVGFESPVTVSGETREPLRTMPRALVGAVLLVTVLYMLILFAFVAGLEPEQREGATLVDLGRVLLGDWGAVALGVAAVCSIGGNLAVSMLSVPRISFALARQGLLPPGLGAIHPRFHTPSTSVLLLGGLCLVFALSGSFVFLAVASSLMRMLGYLLCIAALLRIRRMRGIVRSWPQGIVVPLVAALLCGWIAIQASLQTWLLTGALLLLGGLLYWLAPRGAPDPVAVAVAPPGD